MKLSATVQKTIRAALENPFAGGDLSPSFIQQARAGQFDLIARQYRAAPLLMSIVAVILFLYFDSVYPTYIAAIWLAGVIACYSALFIFQERYFQTTDISDDPEPRIRTYAQLYWITNSVWVALVPIFWSPENAPQTMLMFIVLLAHLVTVTAIGFRIPAIFFSNSFPLIAMIVVSTFLSGEKTFMVLGTLSFALYLFLISVARSSLFQDVESYDIRFRNEELIKELAEAIESADTIHATAEQANINLREREELFRALVENAYDTIILTDSDGYVRYAAPSIKQFGLTAEAALGKQINSFLPSLNSEGALLKAINQDHKEGQVSELQDHVTTRDGRRAWIEASITDLRGSSSVGGLILNIRDVTERKRADDEMHRHLEVLDALATGSSLDAILTKIALSVDRINVGAHAAIFLIDNDRHVTKAIGPSVPDELLANLRDTTLSPQIGCCGAAIESGNRVMVSDISTDPLTDPFAPMLGKMGFKSSWAQPVFSRHGHILGVLTSFYKERLAPTEGEIAFVNATAYLAGIAIDRRQQENRLREASESAEMANRAKSRFLATMSHELRTPLNAIIGFSEVMQQEMFGALGNDRYKEYSTDILTSGRHLLSMIDDILDLSKIEAGRYDLEERDVDFNEVIDWSGEMMRPKLAEGDLTLALDITQNLPLVYADRRALRQVLLNLLSNAVKFTEPGGTITIATQLDRQKGLTISVTDTGIGIPADRVAETLEPFVQVESSMTGKHHGTGLGLSITKHLVEMHNGSFDLTSEEGVGTTVSFTLPAHRLVTLPAATDGLG